MVTPIGDKKTLLTAESAEAAAPDEAACKSGFEIFRIDHLLAIGAKGVGYLGEVRRVDVRAVVGVGIHRRAIGIHLQMHALHGGVFLVIENDRQGWQAEITRRPERAQRRVIQEGAIADQRDNWAVRLGELDAERKANFEKLLPSSAQVFASGTSFPPSDGGEKWETFCVSSGTFSKS